MVSHLHSFLWLYWSLWWSCTVSAYLPPFLFVTSSMQIYTMLSCEIKPCSNVLRKMLVERHNIMHAFPPCLPSLPFSLPPSPLPPPALHLPAPLPPCRYYRRFIPSVMGKKSVAARYAFFPFSMVEIWKCTPHSLSPSQYEGKKRV